MPDAALGQSIFAKTVYFSLASLGCVGVLLLGIEWRIPTWISVPGGFLARVSYSAYLVNIPIAVSLVKVFPCCGGSLAQAVAMWLAFMSLTLGCSYFLYRVLERPMNALRDRLVPA
jgi:peptidoglycan/LPS O-acetylase OafA/YrhL